MTKFEILTLISFSLSVVLTIAVINLTRVKATLREYSDIVKDLQDVLGDIVDCLDRHQKSIEGVYCDMTVLKGKIALATELIGVNNDAAKSIKHSDNAMKGGNEL